MIEHLQQYKKEYTMALILLLLFVACLVLFVFLKPTVQKDDEKQTEGTGAEVGFDNTPPSPEAIAEDAEKVTPAGEDEPIAALDAPANNRYEFVRNPDRARWYDFDFDKYFEIELADNPIENVLTTSFNDMEVTGAYKGEWSTDNQYIIFSKYETDEDDHDVKPDEAGHDHELDLGNVWILDIQSENVTELIDFPESNNANYISNGKRIAFATKSTIEVMDVDGLNRETLHTFPEFDNRSELIYVPTVEFIDANTFEANIKAPTYLKDGAEETLQFEL